jgi:hypothetical protein
MTQTISPADRPLLHQDGFRIALPERVALDVETTVVTTDDGIRLSRNESTLSLHLAPHLRDALSCALDPTGPGMACAGIAETWRDLLQRLALRGMLADAAPADPGVSGVDAVREMLDAIHAQMTRHAAAGHRSFTDSLRDRATALTWLQQAYLVTKAAAYHISPVLDHDMSSQERDLWTRFLKDESWHWRIYRPAMALYGMNFPDFDDVPAAESSRKIIDILHDSASRSPVVYAVLTQYLEKPPLADGPDHHRLWSTLKRRCGFTDAAIRPLWWHSVENVHAGHCDLGAVVLADRRRIDRAELDDAIAASDEFIRASCLWLTDVVH